MYNIAVIGFGYWGPNIVRNFSLHEECNVKYICDLNKEARKRATNLYPNIEIIDNPDVIFDSNEIDIVAIVTPVSHHYPLAKKALETGKHIFVEKPLVETVSQADDLIRMSKEKKLIGVVDHTFLFTSAVMKIKEIVENEKDAIIIASFGTFSTGINIRNLHNIVFASPSKSKIRVLQSLGRGLRRSESKMDVRLFDLSDDIKQGSRQNYTLTHFTERLNIYNEEQFNYEISKVKLK